MRVFPELGRSREREFLLRQTNEARVELRRSLRGMRDSAWRTLDLRAWGRRYPKATAGAAAGLGFGGGWAGARALGAFLGSRGRSRDEGDGPTGRNGLTGRVARSGGRRVLSLLAGYGVRVALGALRQRTGRPRRGGMLGRRGERRGMARERAE